MKKIQENITAVDELKQKVKDHCLCAKFIEDRAHFIVLYPAGFFPNGARASKGLGKAGALEALLKVMERHWMAN